MAFDDSFLEELRSRNDISEVIGNYVNLKKAGRLYKGLCPFHNEKTPSFTVYPDTQSFYCFGCAAGGDVITFIRKIENLDYMSAVKMLADKSGLSMPQDGYDDSIVKRRLRIYAVNKEAGRFFFSCLTDEKNRFALDYYFSRGYTMQTIKHFGLGYAPDSWDALLNYLNSKHFTNEEIFAANLARKSSKGSYYDNFRNRMIIPIIDVAGNVVAFGGRVLDDSKPKYINTSDTLVYKKTKALFALNFAKSNSASGIILCEGYMDAIALHQAGFTNAVACCGTALTSEQVRIIERYTDTVFLSQDADEAGRKAVNKSITLFNNAGLNVKVINFTGAKDPDEFIKKFGAARFKALLEGAENDIEYKLFIEREKYDLTVPSGRAEYVSAAAQVLAQTSAIKQDIYASDIANQTKVSKDAILSEIKRSYRKRKQVQTNAANRQMMRMEDDKDKINPEKRAHKRAALAEERIIAVLMSNPDLIHTIDANITEDDFVTAFNRNIFSAVAKRLRESRSVSLSVLSSDLTQEEIGVLAGLESISKGMDNPKRECTDSIATLKEEKLKLVKPDFDTMSDDEFRELFN